MRQNRTAFTLVELLVVIGIIALLISILLPSLARARDAATSVSCMANLRQVGQALLLYADSNKGKLPYSETQGMVGSNWGVTGNWWLEVSTILGTDVGPTKERLSPVLRCPGAMVPSGSVGWWRPDYQSHYAPNPRMIPNSYDRDWAADAANGPQMRPYQLSSVKDSSSKALVWDAPQITGLWMNNNAFIWAWPMDGWPLAAGGHGWADPSFNGTNLDRQISITTAGPQADDAAQNTYNKANNRDSVGNFDSFLRFRHGGNATANLLFADGHVEGRKVGEVPLRIFAVNYVP